MLLNSWIDVECTNVFNYTLHQSDSQQKANVQSYGNQAVPLASAKFCTGNFKPVQLASFFQSSRRRARSILVTGITLQFSQRSQQVQWGFSIPETKKCRPRQDGTLIPT